MARASSLPWPKSLSIIRWTVRKLEKDEWMRGVSAIAKLEEARIAAVERDRAMVNARHFYCAARSAHQSDLNPGESVEGHRTSWLR